MSKDIIQLNEEAVKKELGDLVRQSVEDTLNARLDEEADLLTNARRYERTEERLDTRAGHYTRKLGTKAGEVTLKVPKLRTLPFDAWGQVRGHPGSFSYAVNYADIGDLKTD